MLRATLLLLLATPLAAQAGHPALAKVLQRVVTAYERGQIDLAGLARERGRTGAIYGNGWLTEGALDLTHHGALVLLLQRAVEQSSPEVVEPMLRMAAKGLVDGSESFTRSHRQLRLLGHLALSRVDGTAGIFHLMRAAQGEFGGFERAPQDVEGTRVAAILALGAMDRPVVRPTLQKQLGAELPLVRLAAAEALGTLRHPRALPVLDDALRREEDGKVVLALLQAVHGILREGVEKVGVRELRDTLDAALGALGRFDWRVDLEVVDLLGKVRNTRAVPALIGVLERCAEELRAEGRVRSRLLQRDAHAVLQRLTGAILPADEPERWRQFWEEQQDTFVLAPERAIEPTRTSAGFFGVPVVGSDVVFLIDTSGSMKAPFAPAGDFAPPAEDDGLTRIEIARCQLLEAVGRLPGDTRFNVIAFATDVQRLWREAVLVTKGSRAAVTKRVERMQAAGATNIFGALQAALEIKTVAYGERYGVPVDEVFLLSDGEPTVGEVVDPERILEVIRGTNRYSKVRIHTFYMGGGGDSEFMRRLAEENGGQYVRL